MFSNWKMCIFIASLRNTLSPRENYRFIHHSISSSIIILVLDQSYVSDVHSYCSLAVKQYDDMLIQCTASDVLFNQLLTWEYKRKHCCNALTVYYPTKVCTVLQPSHLIKVIDLQQLAQKINNWFRCKVPPPSYAACIFILTVNKTGSGSNLRKKKNTVAYPEMTCLQMCALSSFYFLLFCS